MEVKKIAGNSEIMSEKKEEVAKFEPLITFFVCKWCTYAAADLAGSSRLQYPPNIRIVMLPCTGKMDVVYALKAFEQGIDGVLVSG